MAEAQAATKIQSLYRGHAFRCDPANEEILEELHNRLEHVFPDTSRITMMATAPHIVVLTAA